MNTKSPLHNVFAGRKGVKIIHISPLGPNLTEEEWIKWLKYIPSFQQERINYLSNKTFSELTSSEIDELRTLIKEMKMASISQIYGEEQMNKQDALEYINFTKQKNLDSLIRKKLTPEEYKNAREKTLQLASDLSYDELLGYLKEKIEHFAELSMVDSFVLREISKVVNKISDKKTIDAISYEIEKNELMRQQSIENVSKRFLL